VCVGQRKIRRDGFIEMLWHFASLI
jgi:hypothetical protein